MHLFVIFGKKITLKFSYISIVKVKSAGWLIVGISQTARESNPFPLALDQGDYFASEVEHHTYHQLPTLPYRTKLCYSYAELGEGRY